ncbi:MAG: hypothetical protein ABWZ38_03315 [Candidatus Binatia bacterium]
MVYDWMQEYRSCALDRVASFLKYWTTKPYLTVALVLFVAGWLAYRRRWRELSGFGVITIGGALLSEWVKEFVSRPRPSALSFIYRLWQQFSQWSRHQRGDDFWRRLLFSW